MRSSRLRPLPLLWLVALCCAAALSLHAQTFTPALSGYHYSFPRDNFNHPDYQTEWWYYTGNLRAQDGHRFGFELTFFRQGVSRDRSSSPWHVDDLYMAHLALSDISGGRYYSTERLNRAGPGIAGVDPVADTVTNGNWQTTIDPGKHTLRGVGQQFSFALDVVPQKPPVIHGLDGVSQKASGAGHASHYISYTRMGTHGTIELNGKTFTVEGDTWMDHEFFSDSMNNDEVGWDWLSIQLSDGTDLMLYRLRHRDGSVDPYSSGTFVDQAGKPQHLALSDFTMTRAGTSWKSPHTGATYPLAWSVSIPSRKLELAISTPLKNQEFLSHFGPSYWEGAIDTAGTHDGGAIQGTGYLEMTGYADTKGTIFDTSPQ